MKRNCGKIGVLLASLSLLGCKPSVTYNNLMQHPSFLREQMQYCQLQHDPSASVQAECAMVMQVAKDMTAVLAEAEQDPEAFGEKLLRLQMQDKGRGNHQQILMMQAVLGLNSPE